MDGHAIRNEVNLRSAAVDFWKLRVGALRRHRIDQLARLVAICGKRRGGDSGSIENTKFRRGTAAIQQRFCPFDRVLPPCLSIQSMRVHRRGCIQHDDDALILSREGFDFRPCQRHCNQQCNCGCDNDRNDPSQLFPK